MKNENSLIPKVRDDAKALIDMFAANGIRVDFDIASPEGTFNPHRIEANIEQFRYSACGSVGDIASEDDIRAVFRKNGWNQRPADDDPNNRIFTKKGMTTVYVFFDY